MPISPASSQSHAEEGGRGVVTIRANDGQMLNEHHLKNQVRYISQAAVFLLSMIVALPAHSSEPSPVEVLQPLDTENVIWLSSVTYFGYFNWRHPGYAVAFTCSSDVVTRNDGPPINMNVAS